LVKAGFCQPKRALDWSQSWMDFQSLGAQSVTVENPHQRFYAQPMPGTRIEHAYAEIRNALVSRRRAIADEIARHPRPITGCDVHFNRMLEERAAISQEIDRFDAFITASELLTPEAKDRIRVSEENVVCP
jgi:hypothetical protein